MKSSLVRTSRSTPWVALLYRLFPSLHSLSYKWRRRLLPFMLSVGSVMLVQFPLLAQTTGTGGGSCVGWMCGPISRIKSAEAFADAGPLVDLVFMGLNFLIVGALAYQVYKAVTAIREHEDWQSVVRSFVLTIIALAASNFLGGYITGSN